LLRRLVARSLLALLGERRFGWLEYYLRPGLRESWGGAFNGQARRVELFRELLSEFEFSAVVETGTFRGTTTDWLARHSTGTVYSVESNARLLGFARARLASRRNVVLVHGDSGTFLDELLADRDRRDLSRVLFYLDAHWGADLPLLHELESIFASGVPSVVVVDDFEVPGDAGYGYDSYAGGHALTHAYIEPLRERHGLRSFGPRFASSEETGMRRGVVVLARGGDDSERLSRLTTLTACS